MKKVTQKKERFTRKVGVSLTEDTYIKLSLEAGGPKKIPDLIRKKIEESYDKSIEHKQIEFNTRAIANLIQDQAPLRAFLKYEFDNLLPEQKENFLVKLKDEKEVLNEKLATLRQEAKWND